MKKLLIGVSLALALVAVMPRAASAQATAGPVNVDIDISLPGIIVLHYFSELDVSIPNTAMTNFLGFAGPTVDEGPVGPTDAAFVGGNFQVPFNILPTDPTGDPASAQLLLQDVWAVRAIGSDGADVTMTTSVTDSRLDHTATAGAFIDITGSAPSPVTFPPPGLVSPLSGDILLTLDFANATSSGDYVDGVYTITATVL